ncbi:TIGR00299 family protein [Thermoplasmatales archaeon SCGC AB-539-N05]|nr:TIGR00299 family protein [Thermoplasmatales archaeon SCGC AB-539-N05]
MTVAYFDCFSGIAGDMILGALINLGVDSNYLKKELGKLNISGYTFDVKKVEKNHITCTDVSITVKGEQQHHRSLSDINKIIDNSSLDIDVKKLSKKIFYRLAEAESEIHNMAVEKVHFHEVGAVDSIMDIVGASIGLKKLGVENVFSSSLPLGKGFVTCSHGVIPIPAPATVEILKNVPVYQTGADHEMVTPTGAAVITTIANNFGEMPAMKIKKIGYGAGKIKSKQPGLLRIFLGELEKKEN